MNETVSVRPRRTQAERSAATIERLHQAAIDCLVEQGYARTSTQDICRRAGVSQGALFRHFPSRVAFMISLADYIGQAMVLQFAQRFRHAGEQTPENVITLALRLARANTRTPLHHVWTELLVAARTDAELREALQPIWAKNRDEIHAEARQLFPALVRELTDIDTAIEVVIMCFQGEALNQWLNPSDLGDAQRSAWLGDRLRSLRLPGQDA